MSDLKPAGWLYRLHGKADTTLVSKNKVSNFEQFNPKWQKSAPVYAIPDTHRVVPVKPAPEMINAALPHAMRESDEDKYRAIGEIICIWYEMLAAAKEKGE